MHDLIEGEIREALADWDSLPVRVLALGHSTHLVPGEGKNEPAREVHHVFRQKVTYAHVFAILRQAMDHAPAPLTWEQFKLYVDLAAPDPLAMVLSQEEREAAESFAWKVLRTGWNRALTGFSEDRYITIRRVEQSPAPLPAKGA